MLNILPFILEVEFRSA